MLFFSKGEFSFLQANILSVKKYFGQTALFEQWKKLMVNSAKDINSNKSKSELDQREIYSQLNFAMFGLPGTGKNFFTNCIVVEVDFHLKILYLIDKKPEE